MTTVLGARLDLFLISLLTLFLELACIRWFPSHVLFLTFFTNTVLLACLLGISVGCLAAGRKQNFLPWTPLVLMVGLGSAHFVEMQRQASNSVIDVGNQAAPGEPWRTRDLVPHHGGPDATYPATFAVQPRAAIVSNGPTKGGSPEGLAPPAQWRGEFSCQPARASRRGVRQRHL